MNSRATEHSRSVTVLRWLARILSILSATLLLLFLVGESDFTQPMRLTAREVILLIFFPLGIIVGMAMAWRWEAVGAAVTLGSLLLFYALNLVLGHRLPGGPWFPLFASPGVLFGLAWLLSRGSGSPGGGV